MSRITEVALDLLKKYQDAQKQDEEEEKEKQESYAEIAARLEKEYPTQPSPQNQAPQQTAPQKESYAQMAARLEKEYPAVQGGVQPHSTAKPAPVVTQNAESTGQGAADDDISPVRKLGQITGTNIGETLPYRKLTPFEQIGAQLGISHQIIAAQEAFSEQEARYKLDHTALIEDVVAGRANLSDYPGILNGEEAKELVTRMQNEGKMPAYEPPSILESHEMQAERFQKMYDAGWRPPKYNDGSLGDAIKGAWGVTMSSVKAGVGSFIKGISSTLDSTVGDGLQKLGWKNNPVSKLADQVDADYAAIKREQAQAIYDAGFEEGDKFVNAVTGILEQSIASYPHLILMLYTGGASAGASTASLMTNAAVQSASAATLARMTVTQMLKNPQFQLSLARTLGTDYEEAKASGASDIAAGFYAVLSSFTNAGIEIGITGQSGIQGLPQKSGSALLAWIESSLEEAGEEPLQGVVSDTLAKILFDEDRKVLDAKKRLQEAGMGFSVGAAMGGGNIVAESVVSKFAGGNAVQDSNVEKPAPVTEDQPRNTLREAVWDVMDQNTAQVEADKEHQAYTADLAKYDEKQRKVIQSAIDSGILNNTKKTHDFVDMVAKISAEKGVPYDFTNNERLKESGFALDGKIVNGYVTKDGITLNVNAAKALNKVVGHEITHVMEGTELYSPMQQVLFDYARMKGEYQTRYDALTKLYEGVQDADITKELTADLVGDYLFTDAEFINHLSVNHRNIFQRIYDEIKYLCRVATAGSKEARQLEKVKKAFEAAYRAEGKGQVGTRYSIGEIVGENDNSFGVGVHLDSTLLDDLTPSERIGMVKEYVKELGGTTFTAYDNNGNAVDVTIAKPGERFRNKNGKQIPVNKDLTTKHIGNEVKQEAVALVDELIVTAQYDGSRPSGYPHGRLDNNGQNDWEYWTTYIEDKNNTIWEATLNIANTADGQKVLYDISPIKKAGRSVKSDTLPAKDNISQSPSAVKTQFSVSNEGEYAETNGIYLDAVKRNKTKAAQQMVDDAAVRAGVETDTDGKPIALYHGTGDFGFTKIDTQYSDDGLTFWATTELEVAESYFSRYMDVPKRTVAREIGKAQDRKDVAKLDPAEHSESEIVAAASTIFPEYKGAIHTDEQKLKAAKKSIDKAKKLGGKLIKSGVFTGENLTAIRRIVEAADIKTAGQLREIVSVMNGKENGMRTELNAKHSQKVEALFDDFVDAVWDMRTYAAEGWLDRYGTPFTIEQLVTRYNKAVGNKGVYRMYYKPNNPYVIDCEGVAWNRIAPPAEIASEMDTDGVLTTRAIAKWAFEHGYDSVKFLNAVDTGSRDARKFPATVWAFMNPQEQLWSADAVTYDDDGNVIPVGDRFSTKGDIRFSLSEDASADSEQESDSETNVYGKDIAFPSAEEQQSNKLRQAVWDVMDNAKKNPAQAETPATQKNTAPEGTEITVSSGGSALTQSNKEKNTLSYQLASSLDAVRDMQPVSQLTGTELNERGTKLSDQIRNFFKSIGNKVTRAGLGDVELGEYGVGGVLNHRPVNRAKAVSLAAVPDVIRNGRQISYDPNWKGRGYESYTFAAPVTVNGTTVYVAAVVNKLPNHKFYLSEMVDSAGNYVRIEESPSGNSKNGFTDGADQTSRAGVTAGPEGLSESGYPSAKAEPTPLSNPIIPNPQSNVNGNSLQSAQTESGTVGAAEQNFSGKAAYQDLLTDDNTQPDRPGDVRPMEVPKTDGYGRNVSKFVGNAYGAEITSDQMASAIEELVDMGALGFDARSNQESMKAAAKGIKDKGARATQRKITENIANGKLKDGDIEKAMLLYAAYANQNTQDAQDNAAELMVDLATMANMAGRNLQLFKMLRKMTPQGQRMSVQKSIDRYVEQLNSKRGKNKQVSVDIPQELMDQYEEAARKDLEKRTAETEKEKAEIEDAIYKATAAQIKASPMEKLRAWRYMAMLGNVKTQTRNFAGNTIFRPLVNAKRTIGAAMEAMFVDQDKRTKSVLGVGKESRALLDWAKADAKKADAQKLFAYSAKTGDNVRSQIEDSRQIYDSKWLEATREFIQKVPEAADNLFKRREYAVSLASFLKARGYKMGDQISGSVLNEAREYAAQEALKATFNDMNDFSNMIVKMRYKGENPVGKALNLLGEGMLPFRRTPANILVRGVEYSPVNIVRSVYNMATKVRSGEMSAATAIDQMASGLTGTGMMALGWVFAQGLLGIKLVGYEDDEDKKNAGHQSYAVEIGNKSFTIDWAAPANLPVFVGANLYNALKDKDPDTGWLMSTLSASAKTLEPMLELSCLSSLNDLVQDLSYADDDMKLYTAVSSMATSYLNQFIPTLFGQIEQATESDKTQVYSDADDPVQRRLETTMGQMTRKLPGDLFQAKKYDAWGNEGETSDWFESFISPSYSSDLSDDPVDAEIMRLNEAQDNNVTVKKPSKTLSYTDSSGEKHSNHRLTAQQWETMQKEYGQTAHSVLTALMENQSYEAMTDTQKAEAFNLAYEYARETARIAAVEDYPGYSDGWMDGIKGSEADAIIEKLTQDTMSDALSDLTGAWKYGRDDTAAVQAIEEAYALYSNLTRSQARAVNQESSGRVAGCYAAMKAGIEAKDFAQLYQTYYDISNSNSKPTEKANSWAAQLQKAKEKGMITDWQRKIMKDNFTFSSGFTVETDKFDQLSDSGLSSGESSYVMDIIANIKPSPGRSTVSDVQEAEALAGSNLSEKDKQAAMMIYLSASQGENLEQMISKGYSSEDYAHVYRIYTEEKETGGKGTKARTIAEIQKMLGCSYSTAEAVYNIYAS